MPRARAIFPKREVWLSYFLTEGGTAVKKHNNSGGSPYATNSAGVIKAPRNTAKDQPKATVTRGNDLRVKKNNK